MKQWFQKRAFDAADMSIINKESDTEFEELFAQISNEITFDKCIDFDADTITVDYI